MICKPCGIAGDLNKYVRENNGAWLQIGTRAADVASYLHLQCKRGTHCDCRHQTADPVSKDSPQARRAGR